MVSHFSNELQLWWLLLHDSIIVPTEIGRKKPHKDWVKLNYDGVYKESLDIAGCGGFIRDSNGKRLTDYVRKIGTCDAFHVEMWDMSEVLKIARRQEFL